MGECELQTLETTTNVFSSRNYSIDPVKANKVSKKFNKYKLGYTFLKN